MRPLLLLMSTGSMSLNQEISGSGFPPAAHSMVAVLVFSTTFSWGPISMVGKPWGIWFSENLQRQKLFSASRDTEQEIKNQTDKTKAVNKVFVKRFWQNSFWIAVRVVECIRPVELARTERSMKESKYISGATGRTRVTKPQDLCKSRIYYWGMADQVLFGFQIGLGKKIKSCLWLIIIAGLLPGTGSLRFRQRTDSCNLPLGTHA